MSFVNADQHDQSSAAPVTPRGSMFLSSPRDVEAHQELHSAVQLGMQRYLTPSNNAPLSSRSSQDMPLIPGTPTPTSGEETSHTRRRVLVSPPRPRFHLTMRPFPRRAVPVEREDWILELRVPPSQREGWFRSSSAAWFLPIQDHSRIDANTGANTEPPLTEPPLPFLARRDPSRRSILETEPFPKTHEYSTPPTNVFFPQF